MVLKLENERFGKLTVIYRVGEDDNVKYSRWKCTCDCGEITFVKTSNLTKGITKSCGCWNKEIKPNFKHGKANTRLHHIWDTMKQRCLNSNNKKYPNYGGRGILIYKEWINDFINFYDWAIDNGYEKTLTLDRIDVNGNYEPSNCRWVSQEIQQNNRRNNIIITINSITKTASQWEKECNLRVGLVANRFKLGWEGERLLEKPKEACEKSGTKGITWNKNSAAWVVRITIDGKMTKLGQSKDLDKAKEMLNDYKLRNVK
jgi:hypothetical protein